MKQFSVLASVAQASKSAYMITKNESLIYSYILPIADFWKQSMRLSTLYFMRVLELYFMHYFPNCFFNLQCTAMHPSTINLGIFQLQIFAPIIYGYTVFSLKSLLSLASESIWFTVENIKWLWTTLYIYAHFVIYVYHIYLWVNADQSTTYNYSFQTKQNMKCACLVLSKNVSVEFKRIPLSETQPRPN